MTNILLNSNSEIEIIVNPLEVEVSSTYLVKGDKGDKGDQGIQGLSAYEVAVIQGFVGTEQQWLDSFRDRTNHIGTQAINTIEGLQTALDSKINNTDIGVTVQPYDSNLVTFTQSEKDKLSGIQSGAEVNVNADWNAISGDAQILNKPILGTASTENKEYFATALQGQKADTALQPSALSNYETTTQLNSRDTANRSRVNHTGTQAINTVDGLQTALDSKQPVGDYATNTDLTNGLNTKEPNIIQGTVNQYWRGDKSWQILDKNTVGLSNVDNVSDLNKPISTATQSALNLKADLNSPTFTGQLILPNNSRINNIEHFYQTTKPITRGDGSALVQGDRWWKTDDGFEWFWNGTYWLSSHLFHQSISLQGGSVTTGHIQMTPTFRILPQSQINVLIEKVGYHFSNSAGVIDNSNYFVITGRSQLVDANQSTISSISIQLKSPLTSGEIALNLVVPTYLMTNFMFSLTSIGSPTLAGSRGLGLVYFYRQIF